MNILNFEKLNIIILALLPGFITTNLIDIVTPPRKYQEFVYAIRCIFYGLFSFFIIKSIPCVNVSDISTTCMYLLLFLASIVLGIIVGLIKQNKCINKLLSIIGVKTITSVPSAWDDIFSRQYTGFIIVTLIDGTIIKGLLHNYSIVGDEVKDLYLEKLYYKKGDNEWYCDGKNAGIYIAKNQISRIEFLKENNNE